MLQVIIILRFQHDEAGLKVILYQPCDMDGFGG